MKAPVLHCFTIPAILATLAVLAMGCTPHQAPFPPQRLSINSQTVLRDGPAEAWPPQHEREKPTATTTTVRAEEPTLPAAASRSAAAGENRQSAQREERPLAAVPCYRAPSPMRIDGVGNESAWRGAHSIDKFTTPWAAANNQPTTRTRARILWDDNYLYFLAEMEDEEIVVASERDDDRLWLGDVFELFLKPRTDKGSYYEFQVNPANARLDINIRYRARDAYERWRSSHAFAWETAVNKTPTGWIAEGRIPWTDVSPTGGAPHVSDTWRFALCRYDYTTDRPPELSTNAPLSQSDFHRNEEWPSLLFSNAPGHEEERR